jgi:uncharacterized Zn finger protein (UPF0148 family)
MVTFVCPTCGQERTGVRRRCYECTGNRNQSNETRERIRQIRLAAPKRTDETRRKLSEAAKHHPNRFDIGSTTRGLPSPRAKPMGAERADAEGRVFVKVEASGRWRRRAHLVWEAANGSVPRGKLIHHRNADCSDDRLENLQMVTRAEHGEIHMEMGDTARERGALGNASRYQ